MPKPANILIDSTMLFSALIFNGPERRVLKSGAYSFYNTDFNAWELSNALENKGYFTKEEAREIIHSQPVLSMSLSSYENKLAQADEIIGKTDKKDAPLLALALSIENDGIWSSDKHFKEVKAVKIWRTKELLEYT